MKDLDKSQNNFEKGFQDAFDNAEQEPSEEVWLKIDGILANQESSVFKRKIIFYRYVAAASLVLLFSLGIFTYQHLSDDNKRLSENVQDKEPMNETGNKVGNGNRPLENFGEASSSEVGQQTNLNNQEGLLANEPNENPGAQKEKKEFSGQKGLASLESEDKKKEENSYVHPSAEEKMASKNLASEEDVSNGQLGKRKNNGNIDKLESAGSGAKGLIANNEKERSSDKSNNGVIINPEENNMASEGISPRSETNTIARNESQNGGIEVLAPKGRSSNLGIENQGFQPLATNLAIGEVEVYKVPDLSAKASNKKSENGFYAGVNVTPQYFDPNIEMNSSSQSLSNVRANFANVGVNPTSEEQDLQPQVSYAYGVNFGMKLGKKWILNSGIQYAKNTTSGTSNSYMQSAANTRFVAVPATISAERFESNQMDSKDEFAPIYYTQQININNFYEFASIPLKAGYILLDKKLSIVVSTGVSTDLFLKNDIEDQENNFDKVTIKPGSASPYRTVFFNGLAGSEFIYKLGSNYSFSLEPSYRFAISSFSKSGSLLSSHPQSFGIAAGFRYIFK